MFRAKLFTRVYCSECELHSLRVLSDMDPRERERGVRRVKISVGMSLRACISLTIIRILMAIVKRLNALKLLHASISVRQLLQQWLLQIFKQVGYPLIQILCHPLAAQRVSIWPNNKVVTWALGPSLIDLLPGACFSKFLETFQAQRQIFKSNPVTNQSLLLHQLTVSLYYSQNY